MHLSRPSTQTAHSHSSKRQRRKRSEERIRRARRSWSSSQVSLKLENRKAFLKRFNLFLILKKKRTLHLFFLFFFSFPVPMENAELVGRLGHLSESSVAFKSCERAPERHPQLSVRCCDPPSARHAATAGRGHGEHPTCMKSSERHFSSSLARLEARRPSSVESLKLRVP